VVEIVFRVRAERIVSTPDTSHNTAPAETLDEGCLTCHDKIEPMHWYSSQTGTLEKLDHGRDAQGLTCTECHGGNPIAKEKETAHVRPRFPREWERNGKFKIPERSGPLWSRESLEFVRFINPGDLRVAAKTCGECHPTQTNGSSNSMMRHGAMLWGAALYNNGGFPIKDTRFGESYSEDGAPQRLIQVPEPTDDQKRSKGILSFLDPIPRWEISQPGNVLRVFERGGKRRLEVGLPDKDEDPGKPDKGLSARGFGTAQRTDPVYLGLQKTRLHDPTLNFLGTNDHPGDYRSSGCTACHVIYANDRNERHSETYSAAGNLGMSQSADTSIPKNESGHPIKHQFTTQIPTSQCMVCHMHPGENMVASYLGLIWWDNETDGDKMYPAQQHDPSQTEEQRKLNSNPEASSLRGLWSNPDFLQKTGTDEFNNQLKRTQFADFHGHGWIFRQVFKRDREGNLLDEKNGIVSPDDPDRFKKAVHLNDIHLEKGMHCVDCHFRGDSHGNGILYNEPRAAIEIKCIDCHGTIRTGATLVRSGFAAGTRVKDGKFGQDKERRLRGVINFIDSDGNKQSVFEIIQRDSNKKDEHDKEIALKKGDIIQNSMVVSKRWWRVKQTKDTIDENAPHREDYSVKSRYAKTMRTDNATWGDVPADDKQLAHRDSNMTCFACHSSWVTSCFGCHLSMQANRKMPNRHNEGGNSRNFTTYNYQVIRDDVFMLGRDGTVTGNKIAPVRSSSAVLVSSQNQNREWIYSQQQTVSAEGFSGQTFNTHVPHTVRATETKGCSDCHVSKKNDNNAWMAQTLLLGTNFVNFMGRYVYVAADDALEAVVATERTEPQAVIGSTLHKIAYPDNYQRFVKGDRELREAYEHKGNPRVLQVQLRGEYAYVAAGEGGLRVYDVAQIDQKGFSERITTAPVSKFGQKFYVDTKYATAVAAPSTLAVDPARWRMTTEGKMVDAESARKLPAEKLVNEEQPIHPLYAYLYVVDKFEGLILVNAATLLDGDPLNNYLKRQLDPNKYANGAFNPEGALTGANNIVLAGTFAYITTDRELLIVNIDDPLNPKIVGRVTLKHPRAVAVQFRYGFVVDDDGLKVLDLSEPERARQTEGALVSLADARDVYVARTYAYVACGKNGVAIIDVKLPEKPRLDQMYQAEGKLNDARQVKIAMTNASLFAYVADGKNGLRIVQLTSPETMATYAGFSPRPEPHLIATCKTKGEALAVSKALDRDRAVDESGNQIAVFGRRGARPFTFAEIQRTLRTDEGRGDFFSVTDEPTTKPRNPKAASSESESGLIARTSTTNAENAMAALATVIGLLGVFLIVGRRIRRKVIS
jgi:hypothetical protein